jgi:hypothetical protein
MSLAACFPTPDEHMCLRAQLLAVLSMVSMHALQGVHGCSKAMAWQASRPTYTTYAQWRMHSTPRIEGSQTLLITCFSVSCSWRISRTYLHMSRCMSWWMGCDYWWCAQCVRTGDLIPPAGKG